jgi:hypothetical protein
VGLACAHRLPVGGHRLLTVIRILLDFARTDFVLYAVCDVASFSPVGPTWEDGS